MVKTKTKKELLADGWKEGAFGPSRASKLGIFLGSAPEPEASLATYVMEKFLGKEVVVVQEGGGGGERFGSMDNPKFLVRLGTSQAWLPWQSFVGGVPALAVEKEKVVKVKRYFFETEEGDETERDDLYFKVSTAGTVEFTCAFKNLTHSQARALATQILKVLPSEKKK